MLEFPPAPPRVRHVQALQDDSPSAATRRRDGEGRMSLHDPRAVFARLWRFFRLAMRRKIASLQGFGRATVLIPAKNGENGRKRSVDRQPVDAPGGAAEQRLLLVGRGARGDALQ